MAFPIVADALYAGMTTDTDAPDKVDESTRMSWGVRWTGRRPSER